MVNRIFLQVVTNFRVRSPQTQAAGFLKQSFLIDQLLGGLASHKGHQHGRLGRHLRILLLYHLTRFALHFERGDLFASDGGNHAFAWCGPECVGQAEAPRDQGDDHRTAENQQDSAEDDFLERAGGL